MVAYRKAAGWQVPITWNGRPVQAWEPAPLADRVLTLSEATARRTEQAVALARRASDELPREWESLARLLLRAEGVASSQIEGVRAPMDRVAMAEVDPTADPDTAEVVANLTAVRTAVADAAGPLDVATLHRWHGVLLAGAVHLPPHLVGSPRDAQGWIGGTSPLDAALVVPPPDLVPGLLDDLVAFANRTDVDAVTQAAAAHAQFEIVHPYADGNGRVGRVLVGWVLTRRLSLVSPPPVSMRIAVDRGGYLSGLTMFRTGDVDPWIRWFADVVVDACEGSIRLVRSVGELQDRWTARLVEVRADAAARRALTLLARYPVLNAATIASELGVSERAARSALETLALHGIVEPYEPPHRERGRPRRWWVAHELLSLVGA